jgi:nucleoside-diphosphate-sugar epimerase
VSIYTVIGGHGFIGSEVSQKLIQNGHSVFIPERDDAKLFSKQLGVVVFCAGAGDCKNDPFKVFKSNSLLLAEMLEKSTFEKFIYISSTRIYMGQSNTSELSDLTILESDDRRLFNLTKLVSEELCLKSNKNVVILRPSNVYGLALTSSLFLPAITRNAILHNNIDMYVTPNYEKDYLSVEDLSNAIYQISIKSALKYKIYNVASGINTSARDITNVLVQETSCNVNWVEGCEDEFFPINDIGRLSNEIDFRPRDVLDDLKVMVNEFKQFLS